MYSTDQNYLITTLNRQAQSGQAEPTWQKREQIDHTRHKWTRKWTKTSDKRVTIPNWPNQTDLVPLRFDEFPQTFAEFLYQEVSPIL